jgi:hypothetical protein
MTRNWIAVNVLLAAVTGVLVWQLYAAINRFRQENDVAKIQPVSDIRNIPVEKGLPAPQPLRHYNAGEFDVIPAQNLFSETRAREEKVEAPAPVETAPSLEVKPVLVGVTLSGSQRLALISDPGETSGRKTRTKRLGDTYRGYTVVDINESQMVLQAGNRREVIPLFDSSKRPTQGGKTPIIATRVVAFGAPAGATPASGTPARGAPAANVGSPARPTAATPPGSNVTTVISPAQAAASQNAQSGNTRGSQPQQGRQVQGATPAWNERTDEQGRRIIRTPFGDIVRPERPPNR